MAVNTFNNISTSLICAGKNAIINGAFDFWQRGTTFSNPADGAYTADRWRFAGNGSGATRTISQQSFTAGNPITGYEPQYFLRWNQSVAGTGATYNDILTPIEDVRTFAGQTATLSFWAKADTTRTVTLTLNQNFGSGGSSQVGNSFGTVSVTTSWQRFTATATLASISGKTIGTGSYVGVDFFVGNNTTFTLDIWGVQVEAGSVATPFSRAAGTLQGELAACQRYYWRNTPGTVYGFHGVGSAISTTEAYANVFFPSTMRITPTVIEYSNLAWQPAAGSPIASNSVSVSQSSTQSVSLSVSTASSWTSGVAGRLINNNNASGYLAVSAEL